MRYTIGVPIASDCPAEALDELVDQYSLAGYQLSDEVGAEDATDAEMTLYNFYAEEFHQLEQFLLEHFCLGSVEEFEDLYKPHITTTTE